MDAVTEGLAERVRHLEALENQSHHVKATTNASQSIPNTIATLVIFEDEEYDTNSEYVAATGIFTAKRDGYLQVTASIQYVATTTWAATEYAQLEVCVDGARENIIDKQSDHSTANIDTTCNGSVTIYVTTGQTVTIYTVQNSGAALTLGAYGPVNYVCFDWLP